MTITNVTGTTQSYTATATITRTPVAPGDAAASVTPIVGHTRGSSVRCLLGDRRHESRLAEWAVLGRSHVTSAGGTLKAPLRFAVRTFVDAGPLQ